MFAESLMLEDIRQLIETLLKVEALHAGATTPGERGAAEAAIERIKKKLEQFAEADPPAEIHLSFSNHWSKQLFCALAKRYDLQPYRYYRQRHTTVMLRVPQRFMDEVLCPEFEGLDDVLQKYLDEMTAKIISEAIFKGSTEEEVRNQPLIGSEVKGTETTAAMQTSTTTPKKPAAPPVFPPPLDLRPSPALAGVQHAIPRNAAPRNAPCPCGSGRKHKKCCGKR